MEAVLNINGVIGEDVTMMSVVEQIKKYDGITSLLVKINSEGGAVDAGFDIYNYLRSLKLPITTVAENYCCSIATVIFMSGEKRIVKENTLFMIHLPWGTTQGTAEEIANYAEVVKQAEDRILKFYVENTNNTKEAILPLMQQETLLNNEQCVTLGFATDIEKVVFAKVYFNSNINKMVAQLSKEDKSWIEKQFDKVLNIGKTNVKALMTLQDASGVSIEFTDLNEGDVPQINDVATIDGSPAEGTFLLPDGSSYVFVGGVLTEIMPVSTELEIEIEDLKRQNAELQEQLNLANANFTELQNEVVNLKKGITSRFDVNNKREPNKGADAKPETTKRKLLKD
jgi:ATP-dependent Clp protease protease subunit